MGSWVLWTVVAAAFTVGELHTNSFYLAPFAVGAAIAAALVGQHALVLERIANREGVGTVKIGGEVWTARSYDQEQVIDAGEQVEVVQIRGATALVMP